jgi:hypothetical protein
MFIEGRHAARIEGDFVLIGMRTDTPWKVHRWWPVFRAMPPMIRALSSEHRRPAQPGAAGGRGAVAGY